MSLQSFCIESPIGTLALQATSGGLSQVMYDANDTNQVDDVHSNQYQKAIAAYFDGDKHAFDDVHVDMHGTEFQQSVWKATRRIPYGQTRTYAEVAKQAGYPKAVRAVGTALGANPVLLAIPCHRVVPSHGKGVGGFACGPKVKEWLLAHEQKNKK